MKQTPRTDQMTMPGGIQTRDGCLNVLLELLILIQLPPETMKIYVQVPKEFGKALRHRSSPLFLQPFSFF